MNNKQIGLVIAGCKGGYRLLCSNGVADTQGEEISRTLSDIRSVIRINRNHLTLYALEFTSQYKVYSVYRSCNDNGSGAFVNIVVYVPHETRIDKIRELLDNMIEYYFKEYVNPLHGTYYPGTYDNINPFSDILQSAEINEETRHFTHRRSKQDDTPSFYIYNDVSEVDNKTYMFLDEIQEIYGWEKVINSLASDYDVDLYVTGSNSRMMSSEISTYLTGRYIAFHIYTLSFEEYLEFKSQYAKLEDRRIELANYIRLGGFPATHLQPYSQDEVYTIVRDIYNSTIFSDIVKRNQVRKVDQLERVVKYTFNNVGNTFSAKSISDYLKSEHRSLDNETVYSYLEKLEKCGYKEYAESAEYIKRLIGSTPDIAIILGSGLDRIVRKMTEKVVIPYRDIPNFPVSTVSYQKGELCPVCLQVRRSLL